MKRQSQPHKKKARLRLVAGWTAIRGPWYQTLSSDSFKGVGINGVNAKKVGGTSTGLHERGRHTVTAERQKRGHSPGFRHGSDRSAGTASTRPTSPSSPGSPGSASKVPLLDVDDIQTKFGQFPRQSSAVARKDPAGGPGAGGPGAGGHGAGPGAGGHGAGGHSGADPSGQSNQPPVVPGPPCAGCGRATEDGILARFLW